APAWSLRVIVTLSPGTKARSVDRHRRAAARGGRCGNGRVLYEERRFPRPVVRREVPGARAVDHRAGHLRELSQDLDRVDDLEHRAGERAEARQVDELELAGDADGAADV